LPLMNGVMEKKVSRQDPSLLATDRHRFLRKTLCDANVEFDGLESSSRVMESALLTAMGALGAVCGFSGLLQPEATDVKLAGRGMDREILDSIKTDFCQLVDQHVASLDDTPYPFHTEVRVLPAAPGPPGPLTAAGIRIVAGWRMGKTLSGMMGLGGTITGAPFGERETDFLYSLVDHMMAALRSIAANSVMHTLKNELNQARQSAAECALRNQTAKKELEEALFRLSGFNDIVHELSGLKKSDSVIDAFLLVMLGIFSAQHGTVLYADDASPKVHAAARGVETETPANDQPAAVREKLDAVFGSRQGNRVGVMQAAILPPEQLKSLDLLASTASIAILFKVDESARGLLCLGKRLVETQYGAKERELLLAFTHTFLAFLKNSKSFETIQRLNAEHQQKNIELEKTVQALSESRSTIAGLEKAGERIKSTIARAMARSVQVSVMDVALILIAGMVLGLVYNFASPSGIPIIPRIWLYPPSPRITVKDVNTLLQTQQPLLVDARPVEFYKQEHIRGALNLPLALFDFVYMMRFSQIDPQQPIVVYGRNISRHYDEEVAHQLTERGHPNVSILTGGLKAWQAEGLSLSP